MFSNRVKDEAAASGVQSTLSEILRGSPPPHVPRSPSGSPSSLGSYEILQTPFIPTLNAPRKSNYPARIDHARSVPPELSMLPHPVTGELLSSRARTLPPPRSPFTYPPKPSPAEHLVAAGPGVVNKGMIECQWLESCRCSQVVSQLHIFRRLWMLGPSSVQPALCGTGLSLPSTPRPRRLLPYNQVLLHLYRESRIITMFHHRTQLSRSSRIALRT